MSEPRPTDEELIAAFRDSSDPRMLGGVVCQHVAKVRTMISQMVINDADVDDLTQEVFLRAAVVLTMMQGLGVREAAGIEGCTAATMYWRIHKARKILRKRLETYLT